MFASTNEENFFWNDNNWLEHVFEKYSYIEPTLIFPMPDQSINLNVLDKFSYANFNKSNGHSDNVTTGNEVNNRDRSNARAEILLDQSLSKIIFAMCIMLLWTIPINIIRL